MDGSKVALAGNAMEGISPLLITRVSEWSLPSDPSGDDRPVPARKGSLQHLWSSFTKEIRREMTHTPEYVDIDVLDARGIEWVSTRAHFSGGRLLLEHGSNGIFASVDLPGAKIIGHMTKPFVQVISGTQTYLSHLTTHKSLVQCVASLLAWSMTRPAGLLAKRWVPPAFVAKEGKNEVILSCKFDAHFTASNVDSTSWQSVIGSLQRSGMLILTKNSKEIFRLDITRIPADCIRRVDASLVFSNWVIFVVPDMGGPESVYLKLADDDDFEDWFVTLRSFSQEVVYATPKHDEKQTLRLFNSLKVTVFSAKVNDSSVAFDFKNTYVDVCFNDWIWSRTFPHRIGDEPYWGQEFQFHDWAEPPPPIELALRRASDPDHPNELDTFLGKLFIHEFEDAGEKWYNVDSTGLPVSLYVGIKFQECLVMDTSYYAEVQEQVMETPLTLAHKLSEHHPRDTSLLCDVFFDMYRTECRQAEWVASLITSEVSRAKTVNGTTSGVNVLFRGNTLLTRALERYLLTCGKNLLDKTVGRFVRKIGDAREDLELDPARLKGSESEKKKLLQVNQLAFGHYMVYLWTLLRTEKVPDTFRYLFTHLKTELVAKLGATDSQVWSGISAFLFLRFYCPAILNPRLFGLMSSLPSPGHQRALTLMAKILQSFANRVRFGAKEPWLMPMNKFIDGHEAELLEMYASVSSWHGEMPIERVPKELPMRQFMGAELTNPYLIDANACYARVSSWMAGQELSTDWDSSLLKFYGSCKKVQNDLEGIEKELDKPDTLQAAESFAKNLKLYVNWDTKLYGPDLSLLDKEERPKAVEKRTLLKFLKWS